MNDKYRPNNIVVPITHIPIKQVKDNVHINIVSDGQVETNTHNNYDSEIVYDEQVEMNVHNSYDSDIMYEDEEDFIKSRFINYEVMIPISASTEEIFTEDQLTACSNSNEEKQEDLQENVSVNDDKISEPDVDLSFLDEIDVDLIITYLKEVALVEKSKNKETPPERFLLEKDNITKNAKKSIKRKPKYVPESKRKNVKINLDKDNSTKNNKHSTKKEPKYVPPSKRKNLKTNDTRSKASYTKESVIKLLKHVRQQYETEAKVRKIQPNYADAVKKRKTSMTSKTSLNEIRVTKERSKLQRHIHQGAKHRHVNKRTDILESKKSSEIRIENNCDKKFKITKNKHLKSKENFVEASNTPLRSKYRETKHERIVEIIDEKSSNKESNVPRISNNNYANANLNPSSSRGKVLKAKERLTQYIKVKTLKEKYEGLQDKSNIQTKYYLTNVENQKQSNSNVHKSYKKHVSFNEQTEKIVPNMKCTKNREDFSRQNVLKSVCNTKLIESKIDNKANQNKPVVTINDSYKISSDELIELLSQIKTPNQKSFNCSNQQIQSNLLDKEISNCIKTNGGKRETLNDENRLATYISKQDHTTGTLACTQMIPTKSQNKKVCDEDTHNKTIYKSVSSIYKHNSTVQQTNELRKKSQHKTASINTIYYLNGKPGDKDETENVAQILIEQHNNENINAIKNNIKSQGGNEIPLMCDQNMNNKSTNANHYIENTNKIMEEKPKFKSLKHDKTRSVNDYSTHPISLDYAQKTNTKLLNIKTNNNNTQTLANKTNMKRKNEDNNIIKENYVKAKVYIKSSIEKLEENMMPNEKTIFGQQNENLKTSKKHDAIKHSVMQNVHIKSFNENVEQNMVPIEKDIFGKHNRSIFTNGTDQKPETLAFVKEMETFVLQDLRNKTKIKHSRNTEPKSPPAGAKTGDQRNREKLLEKDPKSSDIQSNKQKDNIQSAEHINRIKEIQPKLEDQRKEIKLISIDSHKYEKNKNNENVNKSNERNTKKEKLKPHDKNIDCKYQIHKNLPNKNNAGTLVKVPIAKSNNATQSATKIIEQNQKDNARTLVKEPTAKTNNMALSATKITDQNKNNAGTLVKEPTVKTNNVTQSVTKINEQNKSNNAGTLVKELTAKTNNVMQSATKTNDLNKNNNAGTLLKEPTAKTNNVTQSATKITDQNKNNAGTLVKEPTVKTNNVTQSVTKINEQNKSNNAGTLVKELTAKTNVMQSATKTYDLNKNNNTRTLLKEPTAKTNNVTQSATKTNDLNKNNNTGTLLKEPTAKTNNVMQSATKINEQNKNSDAGTLGKVLTAKTDNVTQSAIKINERNKNNSAGTLLKEPAAKTNVTQSATKTIEQNKNNNAGTLVKEPTTKTNNITQIATNINEQNKNNNARTFGKEPTAKTNNMTQIATKTIEQNKNNNAGTLIKEPTAKTNNMTLIATKTIEQNKNSNAGTLVKEPTAKTNNMTQIATKTIEQNKNNNAGTLVKEPTAKTNNMTQIATKTIEQNKNNNAGTLVKEPTAKTNNVTQSVTKINEQNKNTLVKEPTAKPNNVMQSATKSNEQNTELKVYKEEKPTKTILNVDGKNETKISTKSNNDKYKENPKISVNDKVSTNVARTSDSINARSDIATSTLRDNCKSNTQKSTNQINTKKTDSKKPNEDQTSKKPFTKTDCIKNTPYNPLKQSIVSSYFRVANKLNKNYKTFNHIAQDAIELNISVQMGIYCKASIIHDGWWSRIYKLHINNTSDHLVLKQMRARFNDYPNKGYEKECFLKDFQASCTLQEVSSLLKVFNGFHFNGTWCHLMDYYPLNLTEALWVECDGGLNICQIIHLSKQLICAVKTLKKHRIIHSDIHPSHILMNSSLTTLKLCGFDNAHYEEDTIHYRYLASAKSYRAPEIILQTSERYSIDAWAAACVLFEITTKRPLFKCNLDTFAQQMSLLYNWNQAIDTDFDKLCKLHNKQFGNYEFQGPRAIVSQRDITSYMIEGYSQVHTYTIPPIDQARLRRLGAIVTKMLVLNPRKRLPIESAFFKILSIT